MLKIFNSVFFMAFALSAIVQYNDPDAGLWVAIYSLATVMCLLQFWGRTPRWLPFFLLGVCVLWAGFLLPDVLGRVSFMELFESIQMKSDSVEEAREIGGLAFVAFWSGILVWRAGRHANAHPPHNSK